MEFRLDASQVELSDTVARYCADHFPFDAIAAREGAGIDRDAWRELAAMGVLGLRCSEAAGGSGLTMADAAIVFEQLGSHLAVGPLLWSVLAAPLVEGVADGDRVVTGTSASPEEDGSIDVPFALEADVVLRCSEDEVVAHRAADLERATLDPLDPMTPMGRCTGWGDGQVVGDSSVAVELRLVGTALVAAQQVGIATRSLDVARDYALGREQFGGPIGSFQAVQHLLADMYVRGVSAQSAMYAAAAMIDHEDPGATRAATGAKLLAGDAAIANAGDAVQVLGGMGFTWDMPPNYLLKRAWVLEQEFSSSDELAAELGRTLAGAS